jgi:hypothetical protein
MATLVGFEPKRFDLMPETARQVALGGRTGLSCRRKALAEGRDLSFSAYREDIL